MKRSASCSCGQLLLTCEGEPGSVSLCHCRACQRRTGSAFGVAAFFDHRKVLLSGRSNKFERTSDEGHAIKFHFCPECGGTVYWYPERKPDIIAIALGAFADPAFPAPGKAYHTDCAHPWAKLIDKSRRSPPAQGF